MSGAFYAALEAVASARRDRPAFTFVDAQQHTTTYTFGELFDEVRSIGRRIEQAGLDEPSSSLGLLLRTQEEQTLHYLGALCAGAVPAILAPPNRKLNREYYARTMTEVVEPSRFHAVITDLQDVAFQVSSFAPQSLAPLHAAPTPASRKEDRAPLDASFLQFSSGTTGIKRGVLVRDDAVLAQLHAYAAALELTEDDRILSWLPLYHDMGFIACLNMPLLFGVHTIVMDPIDWVSRPAQFLRLASTFEATLSWNPNFAYAFMAQRVRDRELEGVDLASIRGLINCSEPVTHESQQQFLTRFASCGLRQDVFMGCYAMAETTFALTHGTAADAGAVDEHGPRGMARAGGSQPAVSVGRPIHGVELEVRDASGARLEDRDIGELWVRSPFNFTGYYRDPEATEAAFAGEWYRTGDLGYRVGQEFFVSGRRKDVLIVAGVNVFPNDLEEVVGRVEGLVPGRAVAFARFDPRLQTERITILAESELQDEAGREVVMQVRQWIQASFDLASFEVRLVPPGWLVKSTSGKVARSANRDKWERESTHAGDTPGGGVV